MIHGFPKSWPGKALRLYRPGLKGAISTMMSNDVAYMTQWYNIQFMFAFISVGMMKMLSRLVAFLALKRVNWRHCPADGSLCVGFVASIPGIFAFCFLANFGVAVRSAAIIGTLLAKALATRFVRFISGKVSDGLKFVAFVAFLWYSGLRHSRYSINGYCLKPIAAHTAVGLFYSTEILPMFNPKSVRFWRNI